MLACPAPRSNTLVAQALGKMAIEDQHVLLLLPALAQEHVLTTVSAGE